MANRAELLASLRRGRQADRQDFDDYGSLIATPQSLGTIGVGQQSSALVLPANGRLAFSHSAALSAGHVTVTIGSRAIGNVAQGANEVSKGHFGEEGKSLRVTRNAGSSAGTLTVRAVDPLGRSRPIATVVFS